MCEDLLEKKVPGNRKWKNAFFAQKGHFLGGDKTWSFFFSEFRSQTFGGVLSTTALKKWSIGAHFFPVADRKKPGFFDEISGFFGQKIGNSWKFGGFSCTFPLFLGVWPGSALWARFSGFFGFFSEIPGFWRQVRESRKSAKKLRKFRNFVVCGLSD